MHMRNIFTHSLARTGDEKSQGIRSLPVVGLIGSQHGADSGERNFRELNLADLYRAFSTYEMITADFKTLVRR